MSWTGFKKAVSRATTSVMQSAGNVEKTVDPTFTREEARYRALENKIENLYKEARSYSEAARTLSVSQLAVAESVGKFYEQGTPIADAAQRYQSAARSLNDSAVQQLTTNFETTVLTPLGKLIAVFPFFNDTIKKRSRKLIDYDSARTKLKKTPAEDRLKFEKVNQENEYARQQYEFFNDQLLREIPKVVNLRGQYVEACFEALVKSQFIFNQSMYISLQSIQQYFPDGQQGASDGEADAILQQMRDLAICGNH